MRFNDIVASTGEEISHEISEDLNGTFIPGKGWDVFIFDV